MRRPALIIAAILLTSSLPAIPAADAQGQAVAASVTVADARAVVAELRRLTAANYVTPDKKAAIDAALAAALAAGRYDVTDPAQLIERVNADLGSAANDKHLNISYNPAQAARLRGAQDDEVRSGPAWERDAQMRNHGIHHAHDPRQHPLRRL